MKSLFSPRWTALGLTASLSVPFLAHAVAQQKPAKPVAKKPATQKPANAKKPTSAKPAATKPKTAAKPATPTKPVVTPTPVLPKPSPALVKSVQSLNAILFKNTVVDRTRTLPEGGKDVLKRGWRAAAGNGNRLLLSYYDIRELTESKEATPQRRESWQVLEIPLKEFKPESVTVRKIEKKKRAQQRVILAAVEGKAVNAIKVTMSSKTLPLDETEPNNSSVTNFANYSFTFPDQPWTAEFASKLKEVIAVGAA